MPFLKVLVQGNVKINEAQAYLNAGAYAVGIGRDLYEGNSYTEITKRAEYLIKNTRG